MQCGSSINQKLRKYSFDVVSNNVNKKIRSKGLDHSIEFYFNQNKMQFQTRFRQFTTKKVQNRYFKKSFTEYKWINVKMKKQIVKLSPKNHFLMPMKIIYINYFNQKAFKY